MVCYSGDGMAAAAGGGHWLHSGCNQESENDKCSYQFSFYVFVKPGPQPSDCYHHIQEGSFHLNQLNLETPSQTITLCGYGCLCRGTLAFWHTWKPAVNVRYCFSGAVHHGAWHTCVWVYAHTGMCTRTCLRLILRIILNCPSTSFKGVGFRDQTRSFPLWLVSTASLLESMSPRAEIPGGSSYPSAKSWFLAHPI